jgi:ribosomal protein S18 acetylase RimI-like enzyme
MRRLYVRPAHRRRGVARALSEAVIATARADGYRELMLHTMPEEMAAAQGLYRDLGFARVDRPEDAETPVREMLLTL